MKLNLQTSITAAAAMLLVAAGSATAALIVNPNKIVTGSATGKLVVIDVPFVSIYPSAGLTGGPDWTTAPRQIRSQMLRTMVSPHVLSVSENLSALPHGNPMAHRLVKRKTRVLFQPGTRTFLTTSVSLPPASTFPMVR